MKKPVSLKPMKHKLRARVRESNLELLDPRSASLRDGDEVTVSVARTEKPDQAEALRRAAGSWKGHIDAEDLIENIYRDRLIQTRPVPPI